MTTSTAPAQLIILSAISAFAGTVLNLVVYVVAGVAVFRAAVHANLVSCLVVLGLSLVIALAIGIFAATIQVAVQKGAALIWLLGSGLWLFSGTMFPIQILPRPLGILARAIPFTYAIEAMRGALIEGRSLPAMAPAVAALAGFGAVLLPLALGALSISLRRARQYGTLSLY